MGKEKPPLISIGMPLFNEARFLRQSLDSLIHQDYTNIELIISDNASTDETEKICQQYAEKYAWISYHRFECNNGPAQNFNYVLQNAKGKYFMWAAGHDLWAKNYLTACIAMLEPHPEAIIAYGSSQWIDENNNSFNREYGWTDTRGMDVIARFFTVFWGNMHPILGLIRLQALKSSPLISTIGSDLILLSHLSLIGDFVHATDTYWSRREFRNETAHKDKVKRYRSKEYRLGFSFLDKLFPLARLPLELGKVVLKSNQPLIVCASILFLLLASFPIRYISGKRKPL